MKKKNWKKKLLTDFIVFRVVTVILALSFLTADNQKKHWIEDYGNEAGNFNQTFLSKGYIPEVTEAPDKLVAASMDVITTTPADVSTETVMDSDTEILANTSKDIPISSSMTTQKETHTDSFGDISTQDPEASSIEKPAEDTEVILNEPRVLHSSAASPDSKYIAETNGVNINITAGGLYPSAEIRIRELASDQIVWSMMGYYSCDFLWTPDSRYLAISYTGRTYGEALIVDTKDFTQFLIPIPEQIEENMQEFRPDVYLQAREWMEDRMLLIDFRYTGKDSTEYSGSFIYDLPTGTILNYQVNDSETKNNPVDLSQIKPGSKISPMYIDGCDTLDELVQNAEVIVKGKAGKVISDKPMGVLISFHIENMIKGDIIKDSELKLIQLKDGNELVEDDIYVLALGKDYEEDTYHIIGGYQGIFSINNNEIYCKENKYQEELKKIMISDDSTSISQLDKLCNSFSNRIKNTIQME